MQLLNALPRQPFMGIATAASTGILVADFAPNHSPVLAVALGAMALMALLWRHSLAVYALVATGFFILHSLRTADSPGGRLATELGAQPRPVTVVGTVVSEPKISTTATGSASFLLQAESIEIDGETRRCHVKFFARWRHAVEFGDEVRLFGTAEPVEGPRNPGEFDMRSYLARQDVQRELIVRYAENGTILRHSGGNLILRAAQKSRGWMQAVLSRGLDDSPEIHGLISGMVLGARDETPHEIEEQFQQTGTLHLFAVSGLNVAIVAQLLWIIASAARVPRRWAIALIIPALFFYATITGLNTSSVRAALMGAVLLGGFFVERKVLPINSVTAAAFLILCYDTNQLFSTGFQLSFAVVLAIIILAEPLYRLLIRWWEPDPFLPPGLLGGVPKLADRAWHGVARGISVSLAAWLGSTPLILPYFHLVSPVSLLANLVVVPIAFFVLAGGLLSLVAAPLSTWLSVVFNNANWFLAKIILGAVHLFAQIPGGHSYVEHPHWPGGAMMEINALDLKSGGAVHIRTAQSEWLFDTGSLRDYDRVVRQYLRARGVNRLNGLVLTHGDGSHIGGASGALVDFRPRQLFDTTLPDRSPIHRKLIAELTRKGDSRKLCAAGDEFELSREVRARILFPPRQFEGEKADDQALVIQLVVSGQPLVLLMSDSGVATEEFLLKNHPELRADIIVKGQHHSGFSGSDAFLASVQPQAIVATSRDFPEYERVKNDWAEGVGARGIKLFRQDETGAVQIRVLQDAWEAKAYVTSETFRRPRR